MGYSIPEPIQSAPHDGEQQINFFPADDERRRYRDEVPNAAHNHPLIARDRGRFDAKKSGGGQPCLARAREQLQGADQAVAPHLAHCRMASELMQLLLKVRTNLVSHAWY